MKPVKSAVFFLRAMWGKINFELEEGMEVTAHGYIYLYERGGSYSINIRDMEASGKGDLAAAL